MLKFNAHNRCELAIQKVPHNSYVAHMLDTLREMVSPEAWRLSLRIEEAMAMESVLQQVACYEQGVADAGRATA